MTQRNSEQANKSNTAVKPTILLLGVATLVVAGLLLMRQPVEAADVVVYKSPTCGCCGKWVEHMEENGFSVEVRNQANLNSIKANLGVPSQFQSCHTAEVGGYVIEGHVPASDIKRLLKEKPKVAGLAVPGMPMGSPGMDGPREDPYDVLAFKPDGEMAVYAHHNQ